MCVTVRCRTVSERYIKRAFDLSIFRIEIAIEIDKGCSILSKIETEIAKARSTISIFMPIFVSIFLHEIDKASSTLGEIVIEIATVQIFRTIGQGVFVRWVPEYGMCP
jgi:hypothetical protein